MVTYRNFWNPLAPSTAAASYCSAGMFWRPARNATPKKGKLRQTWAPQDVNGEEALRVHKAGAHVSRLKYAYGPRVTGGNPAWDYLGRR